MMNKILCKPKIAGQQKTLNSFFGCIVIFVFLIAGIFVPASCAVQATPTLAVDDYAVGNNEYIDGASKLLIYDTGVVVGDSVDFDGQSIFVKGNVYFKAQNGETLTVNIGETTSSNYVALQPFAKKIVQLGTANTTQLAPVEPPLAHGTTNNAIETTREYAFLCFCPDAGGKIEINLFKDLYLTGSNYNQEGAITMVGNDGAPTPAPLTLTADDLITDLNMTFTGEGQTVFNFSNGKSLIMEASKWNVTSKPNEAADKHIFTSLREGSNAGVRCFVAMDQNKDAVVTKGRNKVVFQRNSGADNCVVRIGRNSFLTYCSKNISGLDTTLGDQSYAAIAFDVSNTDKGRFELQITGSGEGSYVDGSLHVCGSFLGKINDTNPADPIAIPAAGYDNPFDFAAVNPATLANNFGFTTSSGVDFSQPAGSQAFLRVIDKISHTQDSDYRDALNPISGEVGFKSGAIYTRRGLLISNNCFSIAPMASNVYGDNGWFTLNGPQDGANPVLPYRPGFILGVNGHIEVAHNTFLEYQALSPNIEMTPTANGFTALQAKLTAAGVTDPGTIFKKHNPSAFIVDGLETVLRFVNPLDDQELDPPVPLVHFQAHLSDTLVRHAQMTLYGNASFTCRAGLLDNRGTYNGYRVPVPDVLNSGGQIEIFGETPGEGVYVMDIEGLFSMRSVNDTNAVDPDGVGWHAPSNYAKNGKFRLGSLFRTHDDREAKDHNAVTPAFVTRPLVEGGLYSRYDKPTIFTNASFDFIDLDFYNEDVTRDVIADPLQSDPMIVGGEKATFKADIDLVANPDITFWRLYNSRIHCQESMCIAGTRLLIRELPGYHHASGLDQSNISNIIFYNHGNALDTAKKGCGRIFMFGSNNNQVSAGGSSVFMNSAFANIFRHTGRSAASGAPIDWKNKDVVLKLQTRQSTGVSEYEKSMHMLLLGNESYMDIGWTTTNGITKDSADITVYPFDHMALPNVTPANQFYLKADSINDDGSADIGEKPAEIKIDGDFIFFGAKNSAGLGSPRTVDRFNMGRVIYVGHGGKMSIGSDLTVPSAPRPYIGYSDATIATRVWKNKDADRGLNAILSLPGDQMKLSNPIHPYDLDVNVLTNGTSEYLSLRTLAGQGLGSEIRIAWNRVRLLPSPPPSMGWNFESMFESSMWFPGTRAISLLNAPVGMPPAGLLQMSAGDSVDQLTVSGATPANPFQLYMTGNANGISQLREIASVASDSLLPGEGDYAKIYLDGGGQIGLGTRHWNKDSLKAWNRIGLSQVTLHPNGDCKVAVNNDLLVFDPQPIVPTVNFGSQSQAVAAGPISSPTHRITFFAQDSREIRVPAGKELDLSAFGYARQHTTTLPLTGLVPMAPFTQQIAIGGKLRLIFEPGSTLRFPDLGDIEAAGGANVAAVSKMPVLYLNEESELIFEALQDLDNKPQWNNVAQTDRARVKIVGCGQIWINKNAKIRVNDGAIVGVEADARTKNTNVTISIQREGTLGIGDLNNLGGSLQVGNTTNVTDAKIDFTLRLSGEGSQTIIGRNGFLGFGAGTVDRDSSKISDFTTAANGWSFTPLQNVRNVTIRNIAGVIDHSRIFDGNNRESSLMALGPLSGKYLMEHGVSGSVIKGGGNIMYVRADATPVPFNVTIGSTAEALTETIADNGRYSLLNPGLAIKQIKAVPTGGKIDTIVETITTGNSTALAAVPLTASDVSSLADGHRFKAGQVDFYKHLSAGGFNNVKTQGPLSFAALGQTKVEERVGYVVDTNIVRSPIITMQTGSLATEGLPLGALGIATKDESGNPTSFIPPGRRI